MYIPAAFRIEDPPTLAAFMQEHSFATLITHDGAAPFASHLPMLYREREGSAGVLVSHMARANPQWQHFADGKEVLAIFHGPHTYVSPSWYQAELAVPTWNYAVVHAYGVPAIISDQDQILALLRDTIAIYEASMSKPWLGDLPADYLDKMIRGIVAFEMPISRIEGKFKLSQNRAPEDVRSVIEALAQSGDAEGRAVAGMMSREDAKARRSSSQ